MITEEDREKELKAEELRRKTLKEIANKLDKANEIIRECCVLADATGVDFYHWGSTYYPKGNEETYHDTSKEGVWVSSSEEC